MKEAEVIQYLSTNPEFFVKNSELLESLTLPHPLHGRAVSLLEFQVELLRKSTAGYRREFERLVEVARENEAIMQKTRRLIIAGLACHSLDEFAVVIDDMVRDDFVASYHTLVLFDESLTTSIRTSSLDDAKTHLPKVVQMKKSACGAATSQELSYLFQGDSADIRSHAVLPLVCSKQDEKYTAGVLVLGATSEKTFSKEREVLFLDYISEFLSVLVQRLLA